MLSESRHQLKRDYATAMFSRINSYKLDSLFIIREPALKVSQDQNILPKSTRRGFQNLKLSSLPFILVIFGLLLVTLASTPSIPEYPDQYTVTRIADTYHEVCSSDDCSLWEAVAQK
jgi:hypothetical protein